MGRREEGGREKMEEGCGEGRDEMKGKRRGENEELEDKKSWVINQAHVQVV